MALFQDQTDKLMDQIENLSGRERLLVVVGGLAGMLLVGFLFTYMINRSLDDADSRNRDLELKLERIMQKQSEYLAAKRKVAQIELRISRDSVQRLMPYLASAGQRFGLVISSMNPTSLERGGPKRRGKQRVKERSVRIKLNKASLGDVARFFQSIERSGKVVKIRQLRMKPNFSQNDKINVEAIISTFILTK